MVTGLSKYEQDIIRKQFTEAEDRIIEKINARMKELSKDKLLREKTEVDIHKKFGSLKK